MKIRKKENVKIKTSELNIRLKNKLDDVIGHQLVLTGVRPYFEYVNGERTNKQLGFVYESVLLEKGFEKIAVKIEGKAQIEPEEIPQNGIPVVFDGLDYGVYTSTSKGYVNFNMSFTAKAVKTSNGGEKNA